LAAYNSVPAVTRVILFDIDGTLLFTGGAGSRALAGAFEELFGVGDALRGMSLAGRTDAGILASLARQNDLPRNIIVFNIFEF